MSRIRCSLVLGVKEHELVRGGCTRKVHLLRKRSWRQMVTARYVDDILRASPYANAKCIKGMLVEWSRAPFSQADHGRSIAWADMLMGIAKGRLRCSFCRATHDGGTSMAKRQKRSCKRTRHAG